MGKSQASLWSRVILRRLRTFKKPSVSAIRPPSHACLRTSSFPHYSHFLSNVNSRGLPLSNSQIRFGIHFPGSRLFSSATTIEELHRDLQKERLREREERQKAGLDTADIDAEDEEDYMGVGPLIEKLEKEKLRDTSSEILLNMLEEPTDSESEDDERFSYDELNKQADLFEKKFERHEELLKNFTQAETLDDAFKWMNRIDRFEQKHFPLRPEYRVIGDLMNRLKESTGKDKFLLQQKLNRAIRLVEWKEAYDPNNPANYGVIRREQMEDMEEKDEHDKQKETAATAKPESDEEDDYLFDDLKERDDKLLQQLNAIDKQLEEKLARLDHTFGRKGKVLEEEIRDLAEERNSLTEKKRTPLYRKGFDVKPIDVNKTCKVTKGGRVFKYTVTLACGNYNGVVGFAKAKGPSTAVALQKAYEKCFQNLHYVDRHEEHTIAHAIQTTYKKTKVYLWPASTRTGMKAGRTVQTVLDLAGFKNVKSKVIGSRNPYNTVKALFKALNAIETPKDVQEKFGRTVVESYLL
ncbi:hypothetical protein NMG60_11020677 [Bertholletia excelsa]